MKQNVHPVLVVGAGPVGLTMAAELARHGVRCRIVDRLASPSAYCRAIGVTPRTLEVWDDMGIVREMIDAGLWLTGMRLIVNGAQPKDLLLDLSDLPYGHLGLPQYETERILGERVSRFGIQVERPVTLASLRQDDDAIHAKLERADGSCEEATFHHVVGCDGAHSTVRKALQIPFEGERFPLDFMLGDVRIDWDLPRGLAMRAIHVREGEAPDMFIAIPLPESNRYRVSMVAPDTLPGGSLDASAEHGIQTERAGPPLPLLQKIADRLAIGKPRLSDLRWSSIFRISMRLAQRYADGNAFIAGDAAHIHPPTGGQGMNTGIQDAYNLAWKMALVLKGEARKSLLESYEYERLPVGADVVARTRAQSESIGRAEGKRDRLADTQILISYRNTKWVKESLADEPPDLAPRAGDRAPDCDGLRMENVRSPLRMFDVLRGTSFVLLIYYSDPLQPAQTSFLDNLASGLRSKYGSLVRVVLISNAETGNPAVIGVTIMRDSDGAFATAYQAQSETAYLIRPDGYIGCHMRPVTENGIVGYFDDLGLR
ncbi:MAG TPA: FAD-dependent monooxygenase [Bryobacteraceae bacterium]|nr:FAD-dependent monooxygenase [Bryobacteraceae bacterium]